MKYIIAVVVLIILYMITTYIMFYLISKKTKKELLPMTKNVSNALKPYQKIIEKGNNWVKKQNIEDITIQSKDHLNLHAVLIENKNPKAILIEFHGYRSTPDRDLYPSCHEYYKLGNTILLPDFRCCGNSSGKYITFGIKESDEVLEWINYCNKRFPNTQIILAGISMGATSVLMSLDKITKKHHVSLVIADSAFISPIEEINYCIKTYFHLNGKLFINAINGWCKLLGRFNLKEKTTLDSLKNTNLPILLIHGLEDDFVPCENSKRVFENYTGPKEIQLFPSANHGMSYLVNPKKYVKIIKEFIERNQDETKSK